MIGLLKSFTELMKMNPFEAIAKFESEIYKIENQIRAFDRLLTGFPTISPTQEQTKSSYSGLESIAKGTPQEECLSYLFKGLRELEYAMTKVSCPRVRQAIEEILVFAEDKLEDITTVAKAAREVLDEEGVSDWNSLTPERKEVLKEKIKLKLREYDKKKAGGGSGEGQV